MVVIVVYHGRNICNNLIPASGQPYGNELCFNWKVKSWICISEPRNDHLNTIKILIYKEQVCWHWENLLRHKKSYKGWNTKCNKIEVFFHHFNILTRKGLFWMFVFASQCTNSERILWWDLIWATPVPEETIYMNIAGEKKEKGKKKKLDIAGYSFFWQRTAMALPSFCLWQHELLYLKSPSFLWLQWTCFHQQSSSGGKNYFIS